MSQVLALVRDLFGSVAKIARVNPRSIYEERFARARRSMTPMVFIKSPAEEDPAGHQD